MGMDGLQRPDGHVAMIAAHANVRAPLGTKRIVAACLLVLLATACGSDKESAGDSVQTGAAAEASSAATASAGIASDDLSNWLDSDSSSARPVSAITDPLADPDAVIERYKRECSGGAKPPTCLALRLDVEAIFLNSLVALRRADQIVDPRWYRLAAASETPQLACIGLNELIWDPGRTEQDETLIARALDSPYRGVRGAVVLNAKRVPALADSMKRSGGFDYSSLSGVCVDDVRDPMPSAKWAGGYPGAQFRPFASNESRRWFTTPDPPEKVIAWFEARGKSARTAPQIMADDQKRLMDEMTRLSSNPEEDNTDKIMALMAGQGSQSQWSEPFRNMEGVDEVKYVMIGANQAIAIFKDYWLNATSIVATEPKEPLDLTPDLEAATEEQEMRRIFGI